MHAVIGDRLHVRGNSVGHPDKAGEIVEVKGSGGAPPYLVRFDDGHTGLVFPGPDAIVEGAQRQSGKAAKAGKAGKAGKAAKAGKAGKDGKAAG